MQLDTREGKKKSPAHSHDSYTRHVRTGDWGVTWMLRSNVLGSPSCLFPTPANVSKSHPAAASENHAALDLDCPRRSG